MKISYPVLYTQLHQVLLSLGFTEAKAALCAGIFAGNSRDGVYSHGLNRFPVFVQAVKEGIVHKDAEPVTTGSNGTVEYWDGRLAPGMYTATLAMQRATALAKSNGMGCVSVKNTNHWMRGGTYGWQAAAAGCIGICATNTIANMPPWGGTLPRLGNNPLVIAVPHGDAPVVLDMAMSQYSYGKLQEYSLTGRELPVAGGYNAAGELTTNPQQIMDTKRTLPAGFWKGSGLSMVLDVLVTALSGGQSVAQITANGTEYGLSQFFLCIDAQTLQQQSIDEIIAYTRTAVPAGENGAVYYPGEQTLATRLRNEKDGIPVNEHIWQSVLDMTASLAGTR
ncbi:3-dehydro-L-gulonate 2-dehydrogenase [Deminuibacter soli]|uniref:3-dehydro-L-gulonate 2-dehydrogenase n=1 Tax=Deminuibacter soli TaxID=2291815 RepID=A0A3E1NIX8_9BACT|nr:3-dehydro-L-gulonate 2-dehydrogenase [Deminuibacter soli]RFM27889.1 3-dehydro-L-gulonate 2-dehydrogenase [Deminuibacter soli]